MVVGPPAVAELGDDLVLALDPVRLGVDERAVHVPQHRTHLGRLSVIGHRGPPSTLSVVPVV